MIAAPQMKLPLGQVVHDRKYNEEWVFVGYRTSMYSTHLGFVCCTTTSVNKHPKDWYAASRNKILNKFSDAKQYEIKEPRHKPDSSISG